jgi:histidine decarboxylase
VHVDAALFGGYLPFTPYAGEVAHRAGNGAVSGRYDSIAVSCHKFFGFPSPAGLFITRQSLYDEFNALFSQIHDPEYIHHVPGTITCSRDAVKPAEFVFHTTPSARTRQAEDAHRMLSNTTYLMDQMRTHFSELSAVRANALSNTVYFRSPGRAIVKKYSLATMHLDIDGQPEEFAHIVVMPHVSQNVLSQFLADLD